MYYVIYQACISQDDEAMKRNGTLSLGWFLRNSTNMVVLWDESYFTRLWCVFEMAAFLKLQELSKRGAINTSKKRLKVLMAHYGRLTLILFPCCVCYMTTVRLIDAGPQAVTPDVRILLLLLLLLLLQLLLLLLILILILILLLIIILMIITLIGDCSLPARWWPSAAFWPSPRPPTAPAEDCGKS